MPAKCMHTHMHTHTCVDYIILTIYIFDNKAKCRKFAAEKNETEAVDGIVTMSKAINVHNNNNNNNDYNNSCNNNNKKNSNSNKQKEIHAKSTLEIGSKLCACVRVCRKLNLNSVLIYRMCSSKRSQLHVLPVVSTKKSV